MTENPAISWEKWQASVVRVTERYLSWRKKRRLARKAKQKRRNVIVDWLDAIGSAVVIVLLINQYLLQAYQIPSPSMEPTLLVTDRIFVNKIVYGPELIPGMLKIPGPWQPQRGEVIIFESPEYISSGPVVDILQRVIYMVTLSLVDIDKDENGQPKHHFLIKRAVGMPGDRIRVNEGNVEIRTPGSRPRRWAYSSLNTAMWPRASASGFVVGMSSQLSAMLLAPASSWAARAAFTSARGALDSQSR